MSSEESQPLAWSIRARKRSPHNIWLGISARICSTSLTRESARKIGAVLKENTKDLVGSYCPWAPTEGGKIRGNDS